MSHAKTHQIPAHKGCWEAILKELDNSVLDYSMTKAPFTRESLLAGMNPLSLTDHLVSKDECNYNQYYGLDFSKEILSNHRFGYFKAEAYRLAAHWWMPAGKARGTVFILHGYLDHMGLYRQLMQFLLKKNYAVASFDLPGHGMSTGKRACIPNFSIYQNVLKKFLHVVSDLPKPWHVAGHSTGAAIAIEYLLENKTRKFEQAFLLSPLIRPTNWAFVKTFHLVLQPFIGSTKRIFSNNSHDADFLHFISKEDPLQSQRLSVRWISALKKWIKKIENSPPCDFSPVVIQGDQDRTVDWQHNLAKIDQLFNRPKSLIIKKAKHHLVNELPSIQKQYQNFIDPFLP